MKAVKILVGAFVIYAGLVVAFESLLGYFQPAGESTLAVYTCMTEPVIACAFICIAEHFVCFSRFFKFFFGFFVIRITIRMIFQRHLSVGLFDVRLRRVFWNTQYFVIVSFCHNR